MSDATADIVFTLGKIMLKVLVDDSKYESVKLLRSLGGTDEEQIVLQKISKYWNQQNFADRPDGLIVVTNHRVVFLAKHNVIVSTTDYLSFPLEMIENLEVVRIMLISPAIRFRVQEEEYTFTFLRNADEVAMAIDTSKKSLLRLYENHSQKVAFENSKDESIRLIEQLKQLLDQGAITNQEFEVKKKELLDRM